jgi:hypothetical protein
MRKPGLALHVTARQYKKLADLGGTVIAALTGNLDYTTPSPSLLALGTAVTDVQHGINAWRDVHNRGGHDVLVDLQAKSVTLLQLLKAEMEYCLNTATIASGTDYAAMAAMLKSCGFDTIGIPNPQGELQMVQNFHRFVSRKLNPNQCKLKWKRPLNLTSTHNVLNYKVLRGTTNVFSDATLIGITSKTRFIDTNDTAATVTWYYWVVPMGAAGDGVVSDVVLVSLPAM